MRSIRDFLYPIWRYTPDDSDYRSEQTELNQTVLDTIDEQLNKVEDDTIASKAQSFLKTASDEWLDFWGSWFGLKREQKQDDVAYREALIYHVKHARDTIPAMREAMSRYLHTNIENVQIKEPYKDVFILNDSYLNSEKSLYSLDYYREALMDIIISVPFPPELIDIINWFRPAGVLWVLTYAPGGALDAPDWHFPPYDAHEADRILTIEYLTGLTKHLSLNLTPATKFSASLFNQPFILNDSLLNDIALLLGGSIFERNYYNYVGSLNGLIMPKMDDTAETIANQMDIIPVKDNELLATKDKDSYAFKVSDKVKTVNNLLNDTYTFNNWTGYIGVNLYNIKYADDAQVYTIATPNSSLTSSNQPKLVKGLNYTLSAQVRLEEPATGNNIQLYASVDNNNNKLLLSSGLTENWSTQSISFIYTGSSINNVTFWVEGDLSKAVSVQIAHIKLEEGLVVTPWCKSKADYPVELKPEFTYVYGVFNFREFFYGRVLGEGFIRSVLGDQATERAINKYISNYLEWKSLSLEYFANNVTDANTKVQLMVFSFNLGIWVNFKDTPLNQGKVDLDLDFKDISPYLNDQGVFMVALKATTQPEDYSLYVNDIIIGLDKLTDGFAFQIFGEELYMWETLNFINFINTNEAGDQRVYVHKSDLYDRYQQYYPVRYIRNYIKGIHTSNPSEQVTAADLNRRDFDQEQPLSLLSDSYSPNMIEPVYNSVDPSLPVVSLSLLGAYNGDEENKDILGDLLPKGVFTEELKHPWKATATSITLSNCFYEGHVSGISIVNTDSKAINAGVELRSNHIFSETKYRFEFLAKNNIDSLAQVMVQVYLNTNGYRYLATTQYMTIDSNYRWCNVYFDTNTIFPESVDIVVCGQDKTIFNFDFLREALRIDATLLVDGKPYKVPRIPALYPTSFPASFGDLKKSAELMADLNQTKKTLWSDLRSKVSYDDIKFNKDDNILYFDSGLTEHPLKFGDPEVDELTFEDLNNKDVTSLPNFQKLVAATDSLPKTKAVQLLTYLQSYVYHLQSVDDNTAWTFQKLLDEGITYQDSKMLPYAYDEHSVTVDLGSVHTDIRDIAVHHGSDSLANVEYDSCLQTSVDGKHWVTWYDNYKGEKTTLDDRYVESVGTPRRFQLPLYNVLQPNVDAYDFQVSPDKSRSALRFIDTKYNFLHLRVPQETVWSDFQEIKPVNEYFAPTLFKELGTFNDLITPKVLRWKDLKGWQQVTKSRPDLYLMSAVGTRYPALEASNLILGYSDSNIDKLAITSKDYGQDTITQYKPVLGKALLSPQYLIQGLDRLAENKVSSESETKDPELASNILITNQGDLNSDKLLADGVFIPYVDKDKYPNIDDNPIPATYHLEQHLVKLDIVRLITQRFPRVWQTLGYTNSAADIAQKSQMIRQNLIGYPHQLAFSLYLTATTKYRDWNISLWNTKTHKWDLSRFSTQSGTNLLIINSEEIVHYLDDEGEISVLVCQTAPDTDMNITLAIDRLDYTLVVFPQMLNDYLGGLYPHQNYAANTLVPRKILGTGQGRESFTVYYLHPKVLGKKVCVSFNILTDDKPTGSLGIKGVNLNFPKKEVHLLEPYAQHFSFILNLPETTNTEGNAALALELYDCKADITISGFKVEEGAEESPYVVSYLDNTESVTP